MYNCPWFSHIAKENDNEGIMTILLLGKSAYYKIIDIQVGLMGNPAIVFSCLHVHERQIRNQEGRWTL